MLWSRFVLILMLTLVSARPSPELSLEEIEKELEQLTAQENDASETAKKTSDQVADTEKDTQTEVPKELTEKTKDVPKEKLEALENSVAETEQKKDETDKTEAETEKTADSKSSVASSDPAVPPNKPVKPAPPEIPHRDTTDADIEREDLSSRGLPKLSFKDTAAYRRLSESADPRFSPLPKLRDYPPFPKPRPHFPEAPIRRTYNGYYRKGYDYPPNDSSWNRGGFLPNSDPVEALRGIPSEMTRAERMALSRGTWLPDNKPVKVPPVLPPPVKPDVDVRSYNDLHRQLNDKETEDLIHGKSGLTDAELRKRYLMDLLAEKLKSRVSEAQKRGLKIPTKIMDFLWNYEARRGIDTQLDKNRLSH